MSTSLTRHREGSFQELMAIALPLMLSSFSVMAMLFVDRIFLAHYSLESLNASVQAAATTWSIHFGWIVLTGISEVFVARANGAGEKMRIGPPVWQMIWVAVASLAVYAPLTLWGADFFYGEDSSLYLEKEFFTLSMMFGPGYPLYSALVGFFIGRGRTRLITVIAIVSNILNAFLDWLLIFGLDGWLEPMGLRGAVIATNATTILEAAVLFVLFIRPKNQVRFNTGQWQLNGELLANCLKIGAPGALFVAVELFGWSRYYAILAAAGSHYITVAGICQSVVILLWFAIEGVNKAVTTIAGNLIGAKRTAIIPQVIRSAILFHLLFFGALYLAYPLVSDLLIEQFLPGTFGEELELLRQPLTACLLLSLGYCFFEGVRFVYSGVLTAAGDTFFLLIGGTASVWLLMVLPIAVLVPLYQIDIISANIICTLYSALASALYWYRFQSGRWRYTQSIKMLVD